MKTIDLTPTWQASASMLLAVLENSTNEEARQFARNEIMRMGKVADNGISAMKALDEIAKYNQADIPPSERRKIINKVCQANR